MSASCPRNWRIADATAESPNDDCLLRSHLDRSLDILAKRSDETLLLRLFWNTLGPRTKPLNELLFEAIDSLKIYQPPSLGRCMVKTSGPLALSSAVIWACVASACTYSQGVLECGWPAVALPRPRTVLSPPGRAFSTRLRVAC